MPAHAVSPRGAAEAVSLLHGPRGQTPACVPCDSEACTPHPARVALVWTLGRFPSGGMGVSVGATPWLGTPEASKSVNTVTAFPAQISIFLELNPTSEVLLEPGHLILGFDVMWQSCLAELFSFGFPKIHYCLPKDYVFTWLVVGFFSPPMIARKLLKSTFLGLRYLLLY